MDKNTKANITWSYVAAALFFVSTVVHIITCVLSERRYTLAIAWLCLGISSLARAITLSKKAKENKEDA